MPLEIACRQCGQAYEPSKGDILSGIYRLCPRCRKLLTGELLEAAA